MLNQGEPAPKVIDYTIPNGCIACGADLPVRVTPNGAAAVCKVCGLFSKPTLTVTHKGLSVGFQASAEA